MTTLREQNEWNRKIRDLVDSLLQQAGYAEDSSARNHLGMMNFDAQPESEPKGVLKMDTPASDREALIDFVNEQSIRPNNIGDKLLFRAVADRLEADGLNDDLMLVWQKGFADGKRAQQVAVPQDGLLSKLVRALEVADKFCGEHTADECADSVALPIAEALDAARCALNHPVIVPRTANPDEMNTLHGECYSVDWEYEAAPQPAYVPLTDDLVLLVWRLAASLRRAKPGGEIAQQAIDFINSKGLTPSPLRQVGEQAVRGKT